jgi:ankyrin repeat protein
MASRTLPPLPSLVQYKKQAKNLLKAAVANDAAAIERIDSQLPATKRSNVRSAGSRFTLSDAQLAVAREHGYESWPRFVKQIESQNGAESKGVLWRAAENAVISGDVTTLEKLLLQNEKMFREELPPAFGSGGLRPDYSAGEARAILVRNHDFENWDQFADYLKARSIAGSEVHEFEAAADAIAGGDIKQMDTVLKRNPDIVRARSARKHHSTLLHYVGANGIEYFRQRSPKNIVAVAKLLIDAGADVEATADMYGGGQTTFGLVATSVHPERAGVQKPLMELLLNSGAKPGEAGAVNGCLGNGRKAAAEWYANHGAPLDLEGAAGVGRLDLVKSFFAADHTLTNGATQEQMNRGFAWACEYGRTNVVEFLLDMGMDVGASLRNHGQTGLHWAAHCANISTAKALLKRGAVVDAKDPSFSSTPLSWALHGWSDPPPGTPRSRYYSMVKLLIDAGAAVDPAWLERENIRAEPQMTAALSGGIKPTG